MPIEQRPRGRSHSNTRHDVRYQHIKGFSESWWVQPKARLAALQARYSTRMGEALRHAAHYLGAQTADRKLLLLLTDGPPSDVDVPDDTKSEEAADARLPQFVRDEFDAFLECGILAHGFLRLRCGDCGHDKLLAFSCKRRGFCPSCGARRMSQTAAHLVDHVIPHVPVRQWVLSLPIPLRLLLAAQPELVTPVLQGKRSANPPCAVGGDCVIRRRCVQQWPAPG